MTVHNIFIALYRTLECLYEETNNKKLANYLSDANPYLFTDRNSADPAVYEEFCLFVKSKFSVQSFSAKNSYLLAKMYLSSKCLDYYGDFTTLFNDITLAEWEDLCNIIETED